MSSREGGLVAWQWSLYPANHTDRVSLLLHVLTVPIFMSGTLCVASALVVLGAHHAWHPWSALVGLGMMASAVVIQGRGHARESVPPVPFAGPLDVAGRIFVEQWFTFPRYVFTGGLARAWRAAAHERAA